VPAAPLFTEFPLYVTRPSRRLGTLLVRSNRVQPAAGDATFRDECRTAQDKDCQAIAELGRRANKRLEIELGALRAVVRHRAASYRRILVTDGIRRQRLELAIYDLEPVGELYSENESGCDSCDR
jgi:hypothetical protein